MSETKPKILLLYLTAGSLEEAEKLASFMVKEKLVACVNYFPIRSTYQWKGKVYSDEEEYLLLAKTTEKQVEKIKKSVKKIHSYETPALSFLPVIDALPSFAQWILNSTE